MVQITFCTLSAAMKKGRGSSKNALSKDNSQDSVAKLRHSHGEIHGKSKLTNDDVLQIRKMCSDGLPKKFIADKFNIGLCNLWYIQARKTWKYL